MSDNPRQFSGEYHRVVTDRYSGFEVQTPLVVAVLAASQGQHPRNRRGPVAYARQVARKKGVVVAELGRIPIETGPLVEVTNDAQRAA